MYYPPSGSARYPAPFQALSFSQSVASPAPSSDQTTLLWNTPSVVTQFLSIEDIIREVVTGGSTRRVDLRRPSGPLRIPLLSIHRRPGTGPAL